MDIPLPLPIDPDLAFVSNAEMWYKLTGLPGLMTSAAWPGLGIATPIIIRRKMLVKKLYAFNGSVVSGNCDIALLGTGKTSVRGGATVVGPYRVITSAGMTAQAGTSAWQAFNVTDAWVTPGLYWLAYGLNNSTGQVTRLYGSSSPGLMLPANVVTIGSLPFVTPGSGAMGAIGAAGTLCIPYLAIGGIAA